MFVSVYSNVCHRRNVTPLTTTVTIAAAIVIVVVVIVIADNPGENRHTAAVNVFSLFIFFQV